MIKITNLKKEYQSKKNSTVALNGINIDFKAKGFDFILGPSGSGKTTLLNIIGCLDKGTSGEIKINDKVIDDINNTETDCFRNENIGFIFQNYSLIAHLNTYENIALPLEISKVNQRKIKNKVCFLAEKLALTNKLNKFPNELSGGEKQRVAIARALVTEAPIVLADEPTGALDSENAKIVMEILKEISKEKLVIIVSHNEKLAYEYGDRVIRLLDGNVERVEELNQVSKDVINKEKEKKFKFLSFITSFKLAFRNMLSKKIRSIFTILGGSIGILAACIVISISSSMENYSEYAQKKALSSYPITISSSLVETNDISTSEKEYEAYPKDHVINIVNDYVSYYNHINVFSNDYIEYLKAIDPTLYTTMDYGNFLDLNIISKVDNQYSYLSSTSYLKEMNSSRSYLESEYDLLYGEDYPSEMNELALVVDQNNCIDAYVLNYLQIDYKGIESYTFEDICKKEFKVIYNNDYYRYNENKDKYEEYASEYDELKMKELYDSASVTLKITAILRQKKGASNVLYKPGILYTTKLTEHMFANNSSSDIVLEQLKYGLEKNVLTGSPYTDTVGDFYVSSKEYKLETNLRNFGYYYSISYIRIYTDKFENRTKINEYLQAYNNDKDLDRKVLYNDYMGNITKEFENFIDILMTVFVIFTAISLMVSGIMIALLMYNSVTERTREIGILRTLGFNRLNVGFTFVSEGILIGFASGLIGIFASLISTKPILKFVANVVQTSYSSDFDVSTITSVKFNIYQLLFVLFGSIIIAGLAALIPAIIASKKEPVKCMRTNGA